MPISSSSTFVAADGDGYELLMGRWSRRLAEEFLDFTGAEDAERVLDVGCGTGNLAFALASRVRVKELIGIDFSPVYVNYARSRNQDPLLGFREGDACSLAFPDSAFDRVLSLLALHFIPRVDLAVAEMRRVARPGGVVGAAVWDSRGGVVPGRMFWDTAAALFPSANEERARQFTRPMTRPGELARAFRSAGLTDVVEKSLVTRMDFGSFEDLWGPYEGRDGTVAAYLATLQEADKRRLREAVERAYLDGEREGPRSYAALAWAVKGIVPT